MNDLSPAQLRYLQQVAQQLQQAEQGPPPGVQARLNVSDRASQWILAEQHPVVRMDIPTPQVPDAPNIAWNLNDRVFNVTGVAANSQSIERISFESPSLVYRLTAGVRLTTGGNFPVGLDPLDTFRVQFVRPTGFTMQTSPALGSTILGRATRPGFLEGPAWQFTTGEILVCKVTPLIADLEVSIAVRTLETIGPGNI